MFSGYTVLPDSQETKPGSKDQETSLSLVPCHSWKHVSTATSGGDNISKVPGCHLLQQMSYQ